MTYDAVPNVTVPFVSVPYVTVPYVIVSYVTVLHATENVSFDFPLHQTDFSVRVSVYRLSCGDRPLCERLNVVDELYGRGIALCSGLNGFLYTPRPGDK